MEKSEKELLLEANACMKDLIALVKMLQKDILTTAKSDSAIIGLLIQKGIVTREEYEGACRYLERAGEKLKEEMGKNGK